MISRAFGKLARRVPVIGQGTWNMEQDRARAVAALRRGLDLGLTHIDTAEMYGAGRVEEIVGEAISGRRGEVYLVSKVLPTNATRPGTVAACERSLKRLKVEQIDLYLLHWPSGLPLFETIAAFQQLRSAGKIGAWGVSNFDVEGMEEAAGIAEGMACNQVLYHLRERAIEHEVLPWCAKRGIAVVAYSPFGSGEFPKADSAGGRALESVAKARGATARQVALAFLTRGENVFAIPKASDEAHVAENAGAGDLVLTEEEIARIDAAFPRGPKPRTLPTI